MSSQANETINNLKIKVVAQEGNEIHFLIRDTTSFSKIKKSYSEKVGLPMTSFRFMFDGVRVQNDHSPKNLGMEDGDIVEVYQEQTGGQVY